MSDEFFDRAFAIVTAIILTFCAFVGSSSTGFVVLALQGWPIPDPTPAGFLRLAMFGTIPFAIMVLPITAWICRAGR